MAIAILTQGDYYSNVRAWQTRESVTKTSLPSAFLSGLVSDDGLLIPLGEVTAEWSLLSGHSAVISPSGLGVIRNSTVTGGMRTA